ncbi:hypothetical protein C8R46DRAFT_1039173 [Mycena filopes]|nr:hypothetical protein C8R46DRAFT_1039173 [Mycena filopes]
MSAQSEQGGDSSKTLAWELLRRVHLHIFYMDTCPWIPVIEINNPFTALSASVPEADVRVGSTGNPRSRLKVSLDHFRIHCAGASCIQSTCLAKINHHKSAVNIGPRLARRCVDVEIPSRDAYSINPVRTRFGIPQAVDARRDSENPKGRVITAKEPDTVWCRGAEVIEMCKSQSRGLIELVTGFNSSSVDRQGKLKGNQTPRVCDVSDVDLINPMINPAMFDGVWVSEGSGLGNERVVPTRIMTSAIEYGLPACGNVYRWMKCHSLGMIGSAWRRECKSPSQTASWKLGAWKKKSAKLSMVGWDGMVRARLLGTPIEHIVPITLV